MDQMIKIREESRELFFTYGLKSISMDDIARNLGISKKTIYQYFENKKDLIHQGIKEYVEKDKCEIEEIIQSSNNAIEELLNFTRHILDLFRRIKPTLIFDLQKYYRDTWALIEDKQNSEMYQIIKDNIEKGKKQGLYRPEIDSSIIAKLYILKGLNMVDESKFPLAIYPREKLFVEHIYYHIHGIASKKGLTLLEKYKNQRT